jgi:hypothetical protein
MRLVVVFVLLVGVALGPTVALADGESDALAACAAYLKNKFGVPSGVSAKFRVSGSGERFTVDGEAAQGGEEHVRVVCKTNKGRVSTVVWG